MFQETVYNSSQAKIWNLEIWSESQVWNPNKCSRFTLIVSWKVVVKWNWIWELFLNRFLKKFSFFKLKSMNLSNVQQITIKITAMLRKMPQFFKMQSEQWCFILSMHEKIVRIFVSTYQVLQVTSFLMCFSLGRVSETNIIL